MSTGRAGSPDRKNRVALVMQGGGALGAYEWGAVTRLCEEGFDPVAVVGVSIGAVNAAAIAGAKGGDVCASLERLWHKLMMPTPWFVPEDMAGSLSAFGNPAMFWPRIDYHMFPRWTAYYDTSPLAETLRQVCDFGQISDPRHMRFAVTATDIARGTLRHFCNTEQRITPDHVLASGALPPGFPMKALDGNAYWDGGLFDNTPVRPLFDLLTEEEADTVPIVLINLFPDQSVEPIPTTMPELRNRMIELTYENKFWDEFGGVDKLKDYAAMIGALGGEVKEGSPLHDNQHFQTLLKRRCLKNLHVISSEHVPMKGAMDFSARTVQERFQRGCTAMDEHLKAGGFANVGRV